MSFHPGTFWERGAPYRLVRGSARGSRCRCGTTVGPGSSSFGFEKVPPSLEPILKDREFCSVPCARAFLLETLAMMEGSSPPSTLSDLEEVLASLRFLDALTGLEAFFSYNLPGSR